MHRVAVGARAQWGQVVKLWFVADASSVYVRFKWRATAQVVLEALHGRPLRPQDSEPLQIAWCAVDPTLVQVPCGRDRLTPPRAPGPSGAGAASAGMARAARVRCARPARAAAGAGLAAALRESPGHTAPKLQNFPDHTPELRLDACEFTRRGLSGEVSV